MHVIDGQQRLTTIKRFLDNELQVDNRYYRDLSIEEQSNVSNYELGTVILRLNPEQDIKEIEEIFRRLNRNNYSLNETEKQISRLSDNEYMLLARLFSGDLILNYGDSDADVEDTEDTEIDENIIRFKENPFITPEFKEWALNKDFSNINNFFLSNEIYSDIQIKDNTTTKDIVDLMCIILTKEFHSRILNEDEIIQNTEFIYSNRNKIFNILNESILILNQIDIPEIKLGRKKKYLLTRGNIFSLLTALGFEYDNLKDLKVNKLQMNIDEFCKSIPEEFKLAARNSVMDRKQRKLRHDILSTVVKNSF